MVHFALNLIVLTGLFFIVGMINPKMTLFFMEKPTRLTIIIITLVLFMISVTLFGEGKRQESLEQQVEIQKKAPQIKEDPDELPATQPEKSEPQEPKKAFISSGD